jgi:hypothetical protein
MDVVVMEVGEEWWVELGAKDSAERDERKLTRQAPEGSGQN